MTIRHDRISLSRIEKVKLVTEWEAAFQNIRVCNKSQLYESKKLNCGKCIKCVRTMLELEALGRLDTCQAFSSHQITPEMLMPAVQVYRTTVAFYEPLIEPLRDQKRNDLADIIQKKIEDYKKQQENKDLVEAIKNIGKRYDRKYFNSRLMKFKRNQRALALK